MRALIPPSGRRRLSRHLRRPADESRRDPAQVGQMLHEMSLWLMWLLGRDEIIELIRRPGDFVYFCLELRDRKQAWPLLLSSYLPHFHKSNSTVWRHFYRRVGLL